MAKKRVVGRKRKPIITNHDEDEKRPWSDLPSEILEMIKKQLFFMDQVNFHVVCKSWSCVKRIQPIQQLPWVLVFDDIAADSFKLIDSKDKKAYQIDAKAIKDKLKIKYFNAFKIHESKFGWLLVSNDTKRYSNPTLVLYNPFYNEILIESPPVLIDNISYATFNSNPLDENCKILILDINYRKNTLLIDTIRPGESSWTSRIFKCEFEPWDVKCWMYSEEIIYYSTGGGKMGKFDLGLEEWNAFPLLPRKILGMSTLPHHLVKSSDGVLFFILECNLKPRHHIWHHHSYIHRLDLSSMVWENLDSIGDLVLFIGDGYNTVLDPSGLKLKRELISDKIYWCLDDELKYCSVYEYTAKISECGKRRKIDCSRHFGPIAKKRCKKVLIDPPPR